MITLVKLNQETYPLICNMMDEWTTTNEDIVPASIVQGNYKDYEAYLGSLDLKEATEKLVPDSTYYGYDSEQNRIVGAINIRHYLNEGLLQGGGHIGYGVRPSERRKGYATQLLQLALEECKGLKIDRALVVCAKTNIGSAKTIQKNGGVLENEIDLENGKITQRYWITIS